LRLKIGEALIDSEDAYGYEILVAILSDDDAGFARALALDRLQSVAGNDFGYRADLAVAENQAALERIKEWAETIDPL
jgi:hypothetical protein